MKDFNKIFSSFDLIDEIVYICDMDNYDLIYCNKKTKEILLADYVENEPGYKCYKCLQGLDYPCVFCNRDELKKKGRCVWSRIHPKTGVHYFIHDSIVMLGDKEYRFELAVNASNVEKSASHVKNLLEAEKHLTHCVRTIVRSENFSASVNAVLQTILNFYSGERAYLFDFDWEKNESNNLYEICAPGISAEIDNLQHVPLEIMHFWIDLFTKQSVLVIEDVDSLKNDPSRKGEYDTLYAQGINSIISVPIITDNKLTGFIGVENPKSTIDNSEFLEELSYFIGIEMEKNRFMQELVEMSYFDQMCGVSNRNAYSVFAKEHEKKSRITIGIAFLDMNGLKYLNDNFGHEYGDRQIKKFCDILLQHYSKKQIFRISGDEFIIVDPEVSYDEFHSKMKRLKSELCDHQNGMAAIGYIWDEADTPLHALQNQAEQLMNAQKQKHYILDADITRGTRPKYISKVIEAMKKDTYLVYLQPKYSIEEERVYGAEALIRKLNDNGQIVYPLEFIAAMEKENAVSFVDFFVFEKACVTLKEWERRGCTDLVISTNFSRSTIAEIDFTERILEIAKRTEVNCKQLILEVTESSNVVHIKKLTEIMNELKSYGFRFALDDMGSEYATLEMLELDGLDMAKFDKSLINRVQSGTRSQKILEKLVELCHCLDMECIAEGVETQEQFDAIKEVGCERVQGYLIDRPMPIEEFEKKYV